MNFEKRIRFYESIIKSQPPHHRAGKNCKIADEHGVACCNPKCNGHWGTGCWCCHYLEYAIEVSDDAIDMHLALLDKPPALENIKARAEAAGVEARHAAHRAASAQLELSHIHEEIANALPARLLEGAQARIGVVRTALEAGDLKRADEKAQQYLAEEMPPKEQKELLKLSQAVRHRADELDAAADAATS